MPCIFRRTSFQDRPSLHSSHPRKQDLVVMGLCPLPLAALVPFRWCCCGYVLSVLSNMFAVPVVSCVCAVHDYRQNTHFFCLACLQHTLVGGCRVCSNCYAI